VSDRGRIMLHLRSLHGFFSIVIDVTRAL
jgi:hypothetical protein